MEIAPTIRNQSTRVSPTAHMHSQNARKAALT
jgi:hypothetical protein